MVSGVLLRILPSRLVGSPDLEMELYSVLTKIGI